MKKDEIQAARWYKQAADRGFARAQYNLGLLLEDGRGMPKNETAAAALYRAAAEQGFSAAQNNYGLMISEGRGGLAKDPVQAFVWLSLAAQNGSSPAARDFVAQGLTAAQLTDAQRILAEKKPGVATQMPPAPAAPARAETSTPPAGPTAVAPVSPDTSNAAARIAELTDTLQKARQANTEFSEVNQRLELEKARLEQELAQRSESGKLIEQLREQSRRLSEQVQSLTTDKETAERDAVVLKAQVTDARQDLARQKAAAAGPEKSAPAVDVTDFQKQIVTLTARLDEALRARTALEQANQQLTQNNARLQQERDTVAAKPAPAAETGKYPVLGTDKDAIITSLQRDNARLNDEVKRSTRELLALNQQVRNLRSQSPKAGTPAAASPDSGQDNQRVTTDNSRLQAERDAAVGDAGNLSSQLVAARGEIARLNTEIQRLNSTRQSSDAASDQLAQLTSRLEQATQEAGRMQAENNRLTTRVAALEKSAKPVVDPSLGPKLAEAQQAMARMQKQVQGLQADKVDLEKRAHALEQNLAEQSTHVRETEAGTAELRQKLTLVQKQLDDAGAALTAQQQLQQKLADDNRVLTDRAGKAEQALAEKSARPADTSGLDRLQQQLADGQQLAAKLTQDNQALAGKLAAEHETSSQAQARVAELERLGRESEQKKTGATAALADVKQQLAEANQALEKSGATVAELTAENDRLGKALAAAKQDDTGALREELTRSRRDAAGLAALRDENSKLRQATDDAAALRAKNEQLTRDNDQLTAFMTSNRADLDKAQARVVELGKQLEEARTIRTRGGDDAKKIQGDLTEANQTIEKLNATVAELTGTNDKLEKDLDNAKKSTEAALAAQSQAVSAAQPDAYKMEISTLQAHVKELEGQIEDERGNAAKEVATMAAQLQRTRETNRSLNEANRALLSAKENDTSASREDLDQLQGKVRDLTAAGEELRRQNQRLTADAQKAATERDTMKAQLEDARKVVTMLPGLSDEKAALQERLEAVGSQLVKTQQDLDAAQKNSGDLTAQLAASRQAADKAQADLAAVQTRATDAEKAAEAHNNSVAELTQANGKLELEREDMRRLVESYRADIARLTQNVRAAEQQRTDAERSGQQNIDAVTAQLAQLRRELDGARAAQSRLMEASAAQERDRVGIITQLRTENGALAARLNQAQGTLDQIAAAARLGTPASVIASGGPAPANPGPVVSTNAAQVRYHTVAEGDSLSRISMRYYGTANRWQEIFQANRDILQGSSALRVGMQLKIP